MKSPSAVQESPRVDFQLDHTSRVFSPGDLLQCEYQIQLGSEDALNAIEASVIWITSGKGEEDIGVHLFERKKFQTPESTTGLMRLSTVLPSTPLSYPGKILKIRWCIRVRLFLSGGREFSYDHDFSLGTAMIPTVTDAPESLDARES